jgi:hypothetical protein
MNHVTVSHSTISDENNLLGLFDLLKTRRNVRVQITSVIASDLSRNVENAERYVYALHLLAITSDDPVDRSG